MMCTHHVGINVISIEGHVDALRKHRGSHGGIEHKVAIELQHTLRTVEQVGWVDGYGWMLST